MQSELDGFAAFYSEKHQGHKIEWNHGLGTVNLRARFAAGQKELSVSLYQAVVLLLFNGMAEIPFFDVKLHTGIGALRRPCVTALYISSLPRCFFLSFYALPFVQRTGCCGPRFKAWRAGRKRCSKNVQLEKM
jgi:hypothetical protein